MTKLSSGLDDLDDLLGGLITGDNVVWVVDDRHTSTLIQQAFLEEGLRRGDRCLYVATASPVPLAEQVRSAVEVLDARPRGTHGDGMVLEQALVESAKRGRARVVIDGLDAFSRRWGADRALAFFSRVCPRLFDLGAVAYWTVPRRRLATGFVDRVQRVTQCVLEVDRRHLRVLKAEGRPAALEGRLLRLDTGEGRFQLRDERALGRLGEGLRRLREERHLSQADLARLAGVSPSAISQAEAGHRGLALDTVLTLCERLGLGLDALLGNERRAGYMLARRECGGPTVATTALLDDPRTGLRAFLIRLGAAEWGTPPIAHKGVELVLVAAGLVQVDLGTDTPVMRAGDAVLATHVAVRGWRNLVAEPARLFWILRD